MIDTYSRTAPRSLQRELGIALAQFQDLYTAQESTLHCWR